MNNKNKNIQMWLIVFCVVIFIGLASTISLIFYSSIDKGSHVSEPVQLENAQVMMLQDLNANAIKLVFNNIQLETTKEYSLILMNKSGKTLETMNISVTYSHEEMDEYIYLPETDLQLVEYYKIVEK